MRAWEINAPGVDALTLADRDLPEPGPGQVRVKMNANSINYRDLTTIEDPEGRKLPYPTVPNSDGAGVISAVGEGSSWSVGDRVTSCFFEEWTAGEISAAAMASPSAARGRAYWRRRSSCPQTASSPPPPTCRMRKPRHCPAPPSPPGTR